MKKKNHALRIVATVAFCVLFASVAASCSTTKSKTGPTDPDDSKTSHGTNTGDTSELTDFVLGEADQVLVSVWRHDDLTQTLQIDPNGNISVSLVGPIRATGLTTTELADSIRRGLSAYLVNPRVTVSIAVIKSARFYVLGEVESPGSFILDHKVTPMEAVAMAGGIASDGNDNAVLLARRPKNSSEKIAIRTVSVSIRHLSGELDTGTSDLLQGGDILYVPRTKIASVEKFMVQLKNILAPFLSVEQGIVLYPSAADALTGARSGGTDSGKVGVSIGTQ